MESKYEAEFKQWSNKEYCLEAVKQDGYALRYVREQSETVCLEAVKQNGYALQFVAKLSMSQKVIEELKIV